MPKKRTKKQKIKSSLNNVKGQFNLDFDSINLSRIETKKSKNTDKNNDLGSIRLDLYNSLIIAILIVTSLIVIYWVS